MSNKKEGDKRHPQQENEVVKSQVQSFAN